MIIKTAIELVMSFLATASFTIMFNVPRTAIVPAGLVGTIGWLFFLLTINCGHSIVLATFFASLAITFVSRYLAVIKKMPITVFLIAGIIPLVPGAGIYNTMYATLTEPSMAPAKGIETFKLAGVIAIGIIIILTLPARIFKLKLFHKNVS